MTKLVTRKRGRPSIQSTMYERIERGGKLIIVPPLVTIQEGSSHPLGISVVIDITNLVLNEICEHLVHRQSAGQEGVRRDTHCES